MEPEAFDPPRETAGARIPSRRERMSLTSSERDDFGIPDGSRGLVFMESDVERILTARLAAMLELQDQPWPHAHDC